MKAESTIARIKPHTTRTQQAYVGGWEVCAKMKVLTMKGKGAEILPEVRREFKRAQYYQFNKLAAEFAHHLMYFYFNLKGESRRGQKYHKLFVKYAELVHFENLASGVYSDISYRLNKTRNPSSELIQELEEACSYLQTLLVNESAQIWIYTYMLLNKLAYLKDDFNLVLRQSYEVIEYLETRGIERSSHFYKDMTPALIRQGEYDKAVYAIDKAIARINKGSLSWSAFLYYRLIIEFHRGDYQAAYDMHQTASKKKQINSAMLDTWRIVRGYLKFLLDQRAINGSSSFRVGRFLNSIEVFGSDKSGQNINIIILKILLRLNSNRDQIIDDREAVQKYAERYLEEGSRPRIFFQMLHQIVGGDFNREEVKRRVQKNVVALPIMKGYNAELEMVPYEKLWEMVLDQLD